MAQNRPENSENMICEKLLNQLQVRIQAEPMHGKYSGGNSASFWTSKLFLKNLFFPDRLNPLLGTSDDSKWHPKGPWTILGKSVFWPSLTFLVTILYLLLVQEEDRFLVQEEDRGIFAAANAAATTRLSDGNEIKIRNFPPRKMTCICLYVFCGFF